MTSSGSSSSGGTEAASGGSGGSSRNNGSTSSNGSSSTRTRSSNRIKSSIRASISLSSTRKGYGSGVWIKGMDHAVSWGMDQGMDRGVWIVCGSGALIHTLYFDSYPYNHSSYVSQLQNPPNSTKITQSGSLGRLDEARASSVLRAWNEATAKQKDPSPISLPCSLWRPFLSDGTRKHPWRIWGNLNFATFQARFW